MTNQVGRDKGFYVMTNISENDKIKVGNMSRHKVQKSASQGKKTMLL